MSVLSGNTTLVCLFHTSDHADAAKKEILDNGISEESILTITKATANTTGDTFEVLGVQGKEAQHLRECLKDGGTVLVVYVSGLDADKVERIFHEQKAIKVEDSDISEDGIATAPHDREIIEPLLTRLYRRIL